MNFICRPDGTVTASRRAVRKATFTPTYHLRQDGYVVPSIIPSKIRHAITSMRNGTAPGPDRIKAEHLKSLPPVIVKTLARLFTRNPSHCKVPTSWKTSKTVLLYKKGDPDDIGNYRPFACCL
uniref:Reverse transcriptase n=1 Tax=Haemonchus contortus TaxID=6289 RepID=A0A7I4Z309_HAECO